MSLHPLLVAMGSALLEGSPDIAFRGVVVRLDVEGFQFRISGRQRPPTERE